MVERNQELKNNTIRLTLSPDLNKRPRIINLLQHGTHQPLPDLIPQDLEFQESQASASVFLRVTLVKVMCLYFHADLQLQWAQVQRPLLVPTLASDC